MLTRLKVSGFKNLVDVDVRFGPFTCIAGANGVGKSNLFDAITFLSALADKPLMDAALSVRSETGRTADIRSLFHRVGDDYDREMMFEAEMIVPATGLDDLGQLASASITFLRYSLILAQRNDDSLRQVGPLEIKKEELVQINQRDAPSHLLFPHKRAWRDSVIMGRRTSPFISTDAYAPQPLIKVHQDGGSSGRPLSLLATNLPRTAISVAGAAESPTALLARREMQSWRLLQLEPSSLREPDTFNAPSRLGIDGSHLPATLYHLRHLANRGENSVNEEDVEPAIYVQLANRLAGLIDDVYQVSVDRDDRRELLTLLVTDRSGTAHPARALSDGTLRFLALAVMELEPESHGLFCLEEPENGIHPARIPAVLKLLQDMTTRVDETIGLDNPLRQIIINTHSPGVVSHVPEASLLVAQLEEKVVNRRRFKKASFRSLPNSWRQKAADAGPPVALGTLQYYLNPWAAGNVDGDGLQADSRRHRNGSRSSTTGRVMDRPDLQPMLPFDQDRNQ